MAKSLFRAMSRLVCGHLEVANAWLMPIGEVDLAGWQPYSLMGANCQHFAEDHLSVDPIYNIHTYIYILVYAYRI